jgi:cardiolipin synthase
MTVVLTPANQLTLLRMLLIPVLAILLIYGYSGAALITFCVAGITDMLDGLIARWSGQKTELGAWLDPMADKLLLVTTFIVLTLPLEHMPNRLPVWFTVLMISRDVGIVATVAIVNLAVGRRTFIPSIFGKIATATFIVTGIATLYFNFLGRRSMVVDAFVYASLAATIVSSLHYIWRAARISNLGAVAPQAQPRP